MLQQRALRQLLFSRPTPSRQGIRKINSASQQHFRTRPSQAFSVTQNNLHRPRSGRSCFQAFRRTPKSSRRFQSTEAGSSDANLSLSQRLRKLSREYGWSALGVYLTLSALDFPFCFLAVRTLGTDRIGHWEHVVLSYIKGVVKWPLPEEGQEMVDGAVTEVKKMVKERVPIESVREDGQKRVLEEDETYVVEDHGYRDAENANSGANASIWTQLALAYAIHKSFIFIRVPLTAAVTPKVVKTLRSWGWNIGKRPTRNVTSGTGTGTGVNTKGTGVKPDN